MSVVSHVSVLLWSQAGVRLAIYASVDHFGPQAMVNVDNFLQHYV
jgi:hypothetical protein